MQVEVAGSYFTEDWLVTDASPAAAEYSSTSSPEDTSPACVRASETALCAQKVV